MFTFGKLLALIATKIAEIAAHLKALSERFPARSTKWKALAKGLAVPALREHFARLSPDQAELLVKEGFVKVQQRVTWLGEEAVPVRHVMFTNKERFVADANKRRELREIIPFVSQGSFCATMLGETMYVPGIPVMTGSAASDDDGVADTGVDGAEDTLPPGVSGVLRTVDGMCSGEKGVSASVSTKADGAGTMIRAIPVGHKEILFSLSSKNAIFLCRVRPGSLEWGGTCRSGVLATLADALTADEDHFVDLAEALARSGLALGVEVNDSDHIAEMKEPFVVTFARRADGTPVPRHEVADFAETHRLPTVPYTVYTIRPGEDGVKTKEALVQHLMEVWKSQTHEGCVVVVSDGDHTKTLKFKSIWFKALRLTRSLLTRPSRTARGPTWTKERARRILRDVVEGNHLHSGEYAGYFFNVDALRAFLESCGIVVAKEGPEGVVAKEDPEGVVAEEGPEGVAEEGPEGVAEEGPEGVAEEEVPCVVAKEVLDHAHVTARYCHEGREKWKDLPMMAAVTITHVRRADGWLVLQGDYFAGTCHVTLKCPEGAQPKEAGKLPEGEALEKPVTLMGTKLLACGQTPYSSPATRVLVVGGAPGTGKTRMADLAGELGGFVISKDAFAIEIEKAGGGPADSGPVRKRATEEALKAIVERAAKSQLIVVDGFIKPEDIATALAEAETVGARVSYVNLTVDDLRKHAEFLFSCGNREDSTLRVEGNTLARIMKILNGFKCIRTGPSVEIPASAPVPHLLLDGEIEKIMEVVKGMTSREGFKPYQAKLLNDIRRVLELLRPILGVFPREIVSFDQAQPGLGYFWRLFQKMEEESG